MFLLLGWATVLGAVLGGYIFSHGQMAMLWVPGEYMLIGGAAVGFAVAACPPAVLKLMGAQVMQAIKGSPYSKDAYMDLMKALYELLLVAREQGVVGIEEHVSDPTASSIFSKYPTFLGNHHAVAFMQDALRPLIDGKVKGDQLRNTLNDDIGRMHHHHQAPIGVLNKIGDAMPAIGIVAAVEGIIITMGFIAADKATIGIMVGHALVGTMFGILASYGFIQPLAVNMDFIMEDEIAYYDVMSNIIVSYATGAPPGMAAEAGRRAVPSDRQPSAEELETLLKSLGKKG